MKNFLNEFIDFITGGFFNYIGAAFRFLFSNRSYSELVQDKLSNSVGMLVVTIFLFAFFLWYKLSV